VILLSPGPCFGHLDFGLDLAFELCHLAFARISTNLYQSPLVSNLFNVSQPVSTNLYESLTVSIVSLPVSTNL
jgi:hypothetical protein